jgi:Flp pilus assembly protein TadD
VSDSLAASVPLPQDPTVPASSGAARPAAGAADTASAPPSPQPATEGPNGPATGAPVGTGAAQIQKAAEAESLTEQGIHLCRTARWRIAIEPLRRATELDPGNAMAFYYLGDACNHADELAHALEAFESASRLEPDHWRALKGIGIVLDRMRRPQEAAAAYQRAREAQHKATPRQP